MQDNNELIDVYAVNQVFACLPQQLRLTRLESSKDISLLICNQRDFEFARYVGCR